MGFTVSGPEGYLAARDLAAGNLRLGHTVIVDSINPLAIARDYRREIAAGLTVGLVEIVRGLRDDWHSIGVDVTRKPATRP